ncbi:MAG: dienelactone hydrolase family protein [Pyrinomonadaceae bacterium]
MSSTSAKASPVQAREAQISAGSVILSGELKLPKQARGIVLFAHGSGSSRFSPRNQYVARVIREAGVGTLLFDLLTPNEESADASTGHLRFDIEFLARRLVAATNWLATDSQTKQLAVGYFGASTGGAAALVAASELGGHIKAVVSRGGRPDLAGEALPYVTAPTLLIVGGLDHAVIEMNEVALVQLRCEKELVIVPGATHLFEETGTLAEVAQLAAEWFVSHLSEEQNREPQRTAIRTETLELTRYVNESL